MGTTETAMTTAQLDIFAAPPQPEVEEWRPIPSFDGYEVSSLGRVRSRRFPGRGLAPARLSEPEILEGSMDQRGYRTVAMTANDGKRSGRSVRGLVAACFLGPKPNADAVLGPKNGNASDLSAKNLAWLPRVAVYPRPTTFEQRAALAAAGRRRSEAVCVQRARVSLAWLVVFRCQPPDLAHGMGIQDYRRRLLKVKAAGLKAFGLTHERYEQMAQDQGHLCRLCGRPESCRANNGGVMKLAVDHDHDTGAVRGLLCQACNLLLGRSELLIKAGRAWDWLSKAIAYVGVAELRDGPPPFEVLEDCPLSGPVSE